MWQIFCFLDNFSDNILPKNLLILPYKYQFRNYTITILPFMKIFKIKHLTQTKRNKYIKKGEFQFDEILLSFYDM